MSIKKQVLKSKSVCKVTFRFTKDMAEGAEKVALVGDFNNWDTEALEMKSLKSGDFTSLLELEKGKSYEFRYLVNGKEWVNDLEADSYVATNLGVENCVVNAI
ncbi:MAG: isoamylase early set domain-containing protein [Bacteroidetes bacterium]|nr:isoamylase early set domain-containing protein [Bacteroidota bacterium]